jgi:protoheme IX farnesyltransferase
MTKAQAYYQLTKPGVLFGNALSAFAGFLLASRGDIDLWLFIWLSIGTTLTIASACALNNYLDQDIDSKMERTKKRADLLKTVGPRNAVIFAVILGVLGFVLLAAFTNWLVVAVEIVGYIDYVVLYGMWSKRRSVHGTLVGSISGAAPILAGYVAVTGTIDLGAALVFLILFVWQMPEFYSISIYRRKEYAAAGVPVISVVKGVRQTILQIFVYTILFVIFSLALGLTGYASVTYTTIMAFVGAYWLALGLKGFKAKDPDAWARRMFKFAINSLLIFCALIMIDAWLP